MTGYLDDADRNAAVMAGGYYHTGDVAQRDADGYITYIGRTDDVFKSSDYKVSPFELESVLIEHPAVVEAAVVPQPDETRLAVPKAYVALAAGWEPNADTAKSIMAYARDHLPPYLKVRRIEYFELPKTISGKIRRVELQRREAQAHRGPTPRSPPSIATRISSSSCCLRYILLAGRRFPVVSAGSNHAPVPPAHPMRINFLLTNSSMPKRPSSRPKPERLIPPNGNSTPSAPTALTNTMPASIRSATRVACSGSVVNT